MNQDTLHLDVETVANELKQHTHHNTPLSDNRQGEALELSAEIPQNFNGKHFYIESYGCQMNFSDSEIVASILQKEGFANPPNFEQAALILLTTCSIREKAEGPAKAPRFSAW